MMCLQSLTLSVVLFMYLWQVTESTNWLYIACLGVKRRVKQCETGCPTCNGTSLSGIFSPCVNDSKMDAWEGNYSSYGSFQHAGFHLSIQ
jgi:hypothetical protein